MDNKIIAALTGVFYYLRDEELKRQSMILHAEPGGLANSWALHGRQLTMRARGLVQRRFLNRRMRLPVKTAICRGRGHSMSNMRNLVFACNRDTCQFRIYRTLSPTIVSK